jgi:aspartate carbamoyltransferase catalytic subunit
MANSILSLNDFSKEFIQELVNQSLAIKNKSGTGTGAGVVANLFFENSTRTQNSFIVAEQKLGLETLTPNIKTSSVQKGETLFDTCLTFKALGANALVIRHSENRFYDQLLDLNIPIINAGDGSGDHPSQTLLDIVTIYENFHRFEGLKIGIVGDIKHSRVAHSNMKVLQKLGCEMYFSGPEIWFDDACSKFGQYIPVDELVAQVDVLNLLRIQNERLETASPFNDDEYLQDFGLNAKRYNLLKDDAIVIHPGPINRGVEWQDDLVFAPKSRYVEQMTNGVFARIAMLQYVLEKQ